MIVARRYATPKGPRTFEAQSARTTPLCAAVIGSDGDGRRPAGRFGRHRNGVALPAPAGGGAV